mmetsp:Transcript_6243/g.14761  ORF Transcript_6243/g.14761 Transcript_6243/m.14761 type:complete len:292 (-) Transcript_6243:1192-2067(-)
MRAWTSVSEKVTGSCGANGGGQVASIPSRSEKSLSSFPKTSSPFLSGLVDLSELQPDQMPMRQHVKKHTPQQMSNIRRDLDVQLRDDGESSHGDSGFASGTLNTGSTVVRKLSGVSKPRRASSAFRRLVNELCSADKAASLASTLSLRSMANSSTNAPAPLKPLRPGAWILMRYARCNSNEVSNMVLASATASRKALVGSAKCARRVRLKRSASGSQSSLGACQTGRIRPSKRLGAWNRAFTVSVEEAVDVVIEVGSRAFNVVAEGSCHFLPLMYTEAAVPVFASRSEPKA